MQARHFKVTNCEGITFRNLTFTGGTTTATADDTTSAFGGAVFASKVSGLTFDSCAFTKNAANNGTAAVDAKGGALVLVDSTTVLKDCTFTFNSAVAGQSKAAQGGAIYVSNAEGANAATWRVTLAMTNVTIRANWVQGTTQAGAAIAGTSAGLDAYNCLISANGYAGGVACCGAVECEGVGSFTVFTQSTLTDNMVARAVWNSDNKFNPVFIRSAIAGQPGIGERWNWSGDRGAVLIDSVYQQNDDGPLAPLVEGKSVTVCGKSFTASNSVRGNPQFVGEGEATATAAKERNAGWRPVDGRTYAAIYVAPNGSDAAGNGSSAAPFRSLTKAVSAAECGTTIHLAEGTYAPSAGETLPIDLSFKECLTICGVGAGKTVFNGEQGEKGADAVRLFTIADAPQIRFKDLTITGGYVETAVKGNPSVALIAQANGLIFENVAFAGNSVRSTKSATINGLLVADCSNIRFYGCSFADNAYRAFRSWGYLSYLAGGLLAATASSVTIDRCAFRDFTIDLSVGSTYGSANTYMAEGLLFYLDGRTGSGTYRIRNSLFVGNGKIVNNTNESTLRESSTYLYLPSMSPINNGCKEFAVFENNTVLHESTGYFFDIGQLGLRVRNCIIAGKGGKILTLSQYGSDLPEIAYVSNTLFERIAEEDNSLLKFCNYLTEETVWTGVANFKNADAGDYRLTDDSANALDKGCVQPWMADATDLEGNPRLAGFYSQKNALPDLGCYERQKIWGLVIRIR